MIRHYYLKGEEPILEEDVVYWAIQFETMLKQDDHIIKEDTIDPYFISTVFLGVDRSFSEDENDLPVLWETRVFKDKKDLLLGLYDSLEKATSGHDQHVDLIRIKIQKEKRRMKDGNTK